MSRRSSILCLLALSLAGAGSAFAQTKPGWIADKESSCKAWNPNPLPDESIRWSGGCVDGLADGWGTLQWYRAGKPGDRYEGEYHRGRMEGRGILTWENGDRYDGEYSANIQQGRGVFTFASGARYSGEFKNDRYSGHGLFTFTSGNRYEGAFASGTFEGQGTYSYANGDRYEGGWRAGREHGHGVYVYSGGDRYDGDWVEGRAQGRGTLTLAGERFTGQWFDGCLVGSARSAWIDVEDRACQAPPPSRRGKPPP